MLPALEGAAQVGQVNVVGQTGPVTDTEGLQRGLTDERDVDLFRANSQIGMNAIPREMHRRQRLTTNHRGNIVIKTTIAPMIAQKINGQRGGNTTKSEFVHSLTSSTSSNTESLHQ